MVLCSMPQEFTRTCTVCRAGRDLAEGTVEGGRGGLAPAGNEQISVPIVGCVDPHPEIGRAVQWLYEILHKARQTAERHPQAN